MTKNIDLPPPLARIKDDVADAELDKVSGGDKTKTAPRSPSVSEIVVTKSTDIASPKLLD